MNDVAVYQQQTPVFKLTHTHDTRTTKTRTLVGIENKSNEAVRTA